MAGGSPYQLVTPNSPFIPSPYGLSSVVNWQETADDRWQMGVKWEPVCVTGAGSTVSVCITGSQITVPDKTPTWSQLTRGARPFTVFSEIDCSPVGWWERFEERAAQGLTQAEAWQVERTFQTGLAAGITNMVLPNLTATGPISDAGDSSILLQPATVLISGAQAVDIVEGIGRLEQALSGNCYAGGTPVIHIPVQIAAELASEAMLEVRGPRLTLKHSGSWVAVGAGYNPAYGPGGITAAAGQTWIFATGQIFGYRGRVNLIGNATQSFDRSENTMKRIAERTVLLGWDCCLAAINVTLGGEYAGLYGTAGPAT